MWDSFPAEDRLLLKPEERVGLFKVEYRISSRRLGPFFKDSAAIRAADRRSSSSSICDCDADSVSSDGCFLSVNLFTSSSIGNVGKGAMDARAKDFRGWSASFVFLGGTCFKVSSGEEGSDSGAFKGLFRFEDAAFLLASATLFNV